jgi:C_GCAxxG_C_C family probable redox protein
MGRNFIMSKHEESKEKVLCYFNEGNNCCESVVMAVCDYLGVDKEMPQKISTPFGSGMSRNGSNCGALNAAFICMGLVGGRKSCEESRDTSYLPSDRIFAKFKEKYGSTYCLDITGVNLRDPEEAAKKKEWMHNELCGPLVKQVTEWVLEEIDNR